LHIPAKKLVRHQKFGSKKKAKWEKNTITGFTNPHEVPEPGGQG